MLKNRSLRLAALLSAALGLAPSALAAAETPQVGTPYVFETVDSYLVATHSRIEVTGILQGESAPRTLFFSYNLSTTAFDVGQHVARCDRLALLAMNKPGLYLLTMVQNGSTFAPTCRLTRR
ncbi:hypothetical protein [Pyxidicoccus trucidator]|uniref:hypothetical protein n=1 Tax=Pyxidicoccus trucidator TaxID=2709662 RepID=UPI0013DCE8F1|nr:hypothetical protein [Pyxidicoccus trucidator]